MNKTKFQELIETKEQDSPIFEWHHAIKWIVAFTCALLFACLLGALSADKTTALDQFGYGILSTLKSPAMTSFMKFITEFGGAYVIVPATLIILCIIKKPRLKCAIVGNLAGILLVNQGLKYIIQRPRPDASIRLIEQSGFSFPSGHSMCSMAFYGFLIYLSFRYLKNNLLRWAITISLSILIFVVGASRIYLGVHYTSDVLAGYAITVAYLISYVTLINYINYQSRRHQAMREAAAEYDAKHKKD